VTSSSSSIATDAQGSVSLEEKDGKKHALIKDANGQVGFDGEVTTEAQRAAMPEEARRRLKLVDGTFSVPGLSSPPTAGPTAQVRICSSPVFPRSRPPTADGANMWVQANPTVSATAYEWRYIGKGLGHARHATRHRRHRRWLRPDGMMPVHLCAIEPHRQMPLGPQIAVQPPNPSNATAPTAPRLWPYQSASCAARRGQCGCRVVSCSA